MQNDFGTFIAVRLKNDDDGSCASSYLKTAADVVAWMAANPDVASWRVEGTICARLDSTWRNDGKTSHRYFQNARTVAQLTEDLRFAGHA